MTGSEGNLRHAIGMALTLGATAAQPQGEALAEGLDGDRPDQEFETIVVTGSNVRRVDVETANPVITIDRGTIERSGKLTLGDVLQDLPAVTGPITNPRVNNGGGTGASTISLRGLGAERTLILVDGHRYLYGDVNAIPAVAIERIEILSDGASSVYGSDAIGGVVNFILRSNYQGAEMAVDYGISDRDDGQRQGYHFVFGQSTDKGGILAGIDYDKFDSVLAANRDFSQHALGLYYGMVSLGGSTSTPGGRIELPAALGDQFACDRPYATLKTLGSIGNPPSLDDFRCFDSATDLYDYQGHGNLLLTPQERTSAFSLAHYRLTDDVEAYVEYFLNKTQSARQIAPSAFYTGSSRLVISAQSYYNPFGVEFSRDGDYQFRTRSIGNGNRIGNFGTRAAQATAELRGTLGISDWQWNAYVNYGHFTQLQHTEGYINVAKLSRALGPSYKDAQGNVVCGEDPALGGSGPIAGCVPVDLFDVIDPLTVAALDSASGNTFTSTFFAEKSFVAEADGGLWTLPAGRMQLAAGASYRRQSTRRVPDASEIPDEAGVCDVGSGCVAPLAGAYDVKEAYVELLVPLLRDLPFASVVNLTVGDRYSRYSAFGSTNNAKFALEYRPTDDLLLRATVSGVFRAPTVADLYAGPSRSGARVDDPCFGLVGSNAACAGVPGDGSFGPLPGEQAGVGAPSEGAVTAGLPIGPEHGKSFDWGFVYDPHWARGLSLSADLWRVSLDNLIGDIGAQTVLNLCYLADGGPYCGLIHRHARGIEEAQIEYVVVPRGNLGRADVKGVDMAVHYRAQAGALGNFAVSFRATYLDRFTDDLAPGLPGDIPQEFAGHYTTDKSAIQYANYSRWKALAGVNWNRGPWRAAWTLRYVGKYTVGYARPDYNASADGSVSDVELKYGASVYHNVMFGCDIPALNARIDIGIDNLADKQPALIYENNTVNGNVDANTFDTIGRFYWARVTAKF